LKKPQTPVIRARKRPQQARSARLVEDILEAALRVLAREGARRFTTVRVAEEAGVSVGSLYQYFPNKESLLFRLQADEWKDTGDILAEILRDPRHAPLDRLRRAIRTFFRSEREEAELRVALGEASALYRDAPETREHGTSVERWMHDFIREALPHASAKERSAAAEVVLLTMTALGKVVTAEKKRTQREVDAWAEIVAEMLCGYLRGVSRSSG